VVDHHDHRAGGTYRGALLFPGDVVICRESDSDLIVESVLGIICVVLIGLGLYVAAEAWGRIRGLLRERSEVA